MPDEPEKPVEDSRLFSVSVRAWIVVIITFSICAMSLMGKEVVEPLYGLAYIAVGYYFGQKNK
jgi:hypothetical protein